MNTDDLGFDLANLSFDIAEWSQKTFGSDKERGPVGSLKHLAKEVQECLADPTDLMEWADILILFLDGSRRAGFTPMQVIEAAHEKMRTNRARVWPKPSSDEPVEHLKG